MSAHFGVIWSQIMYLCNCFFILLFLIVEIKTEEDMYVAPSLFLNHGGGPYPILGEENNLEIAESLKSVKDIVDLKKLKAIIVVTAHWEADIVSISSGKHHDLYFDYYNFPAESYKYQYNAPGEPDLALDIHRAFESEGIKSKLDSERGWDHGVFIPMMLSNPSANIPVVQLSILANQDAEQHYKLGEVLHQFRKKGIAIFGSGMSYHNMAEFRKAHSVVEINVVNEAFDNFINEACTGDPKDRKRRLQNWQDEPGALEAHPFREADHFMPLIVNAGAGGLKSAQKVFSGVFLGKFKLSGYIWREE